jgi:hypothetical protein
MCRPRQHPLSAIHLFFKRVIGSEPREMRGLRQPTQFGGKKPVSFYLPSGGSYNILQTV